MTHVTRMSCWEGSQSDSIEVLVPAMPPMLCPHRLCALTASVCLCPPLLGVAPCITHQGDYDSARYMYGGQILVNSPGYLARALIKFDNVELAQMGQAFRLGRYSIHWHMHGDVAFQSWVRGCAIHHTYNRAATIHGTHRAVLQNNVAYNTMGHTFFLEVRGTASAAAEPVRQCLTGCRQGQGSGPWGTWSHMLLPCACRPPARRTALRRAT